MFKKKLSSILKQVEFSVARKFFIWIKYEFLNSILVISPANCTEPNKNSLNDWNIFILEIR